MERVLKNYGWCKVFERNGEYYLSHDVGGVAIQMKEDKVSKEDAELSAKDEKYAERITIELIKKANH